MIKLSNLEPGNPLVNPRRIIEGIFGKSETESQIICEKYTRNLSPRQRRDWLQQTRQFTGKLYEKPVTLLQSYLQD